MSNGLKILTAAQKASKRSSSSLQAQTLEAVNTMSSKLDRLIEVIQSTHTPVQAPVLGSFNWAPVIQGLVSGVASSLGATVNFPSSRLNLALLIKL